MFSHLDAAFRSLVMDWGLLLKMCTLERAGPSLIGEILVKAGSCQWVNAGCLTLLHGKQCRVNNGQHLLLLEKNLSLRVLALCLLSPPTVARITQGGSILEASVLMQTILSSSGTERARKKHGCMGWKWEVIPFGWFLLGAYILATEWDILSSATSWNETCLGSITYWRGVSEWGPVVWVCPSGSGHYRA